MKDATKAMINSMLAKAIGHELISVQHGVTKVFTYHPTSLVQHRQWVDFDYRDPAVMWPICEAYRCFPDARLLSSGKLDCWEISVWSKKRRSWVRASGRTAAEAASTMVITMAEIDGVKGVWVRP